MDPYRNVANVEHCLRQRELKQQRIASTNVSGTEAADPRTRGLGTLNLIVCRDVLHRDSFLHSSSLSVVNKQRRHACGAPPVERQSCAGINPSAQQYQHGTIHSPIMTARRGSGQGIPELT